MAKFEFEVQFTEPQDISDMIVQSTHIVDVPNIIKTIIIDDRDYFIDNLSENMMNFKTALDDYLDDYADQNNADLEAKILDEVIVKNDNNFYDINVTHSDNSNNSDNSNRLQNNSLDDIYTHVETVQFPEATVLNSNHLEEKTLDEILDMVPDIEVKQAQNTNTLQGYSKDDLVTEIKSEIVDSESNDATTLQGKSLEDIMNEVHDKVENSSTDWRAFDAINFDGKSSDDWTDIIIETKVNSAVNSDTIDGKSLSDIEEERIASIKTATDNYLDDYDEDITKKITRTQVNLSSDTVLFDGDDRDTWIQTIVETKVDLSEDTNNFAGKDLNDWENRINDLIIHNDDLVEILKDDAEDNWKVKDSEHADTADTVSNLDSDLREDIINDTVEAIGDHERFIDAALLEGKSADEIINAANEKSAADTIAMGAKYVGRDDSPSSNTDIMTSTDTVIESSDELINGLIYNMNDFIVSSYDNKDEDKDYSVLFEPEILDIWTNIETQYNSNGLPISKIFHYDYDVNLNIRKGIQLHDHFYGISSSADNDTELVNFYFDQNGIMTVIGTGTDDDEVTITWRDDSTDTGTVKDGYFKISSSNPQERFLEKEDLSISKSNYSVIEVKYFYDNNILIKKEYYNMAGDLYLTKTFNNEFSSTPTTSEIILDIRSFDETLVSGETTIINSLIIEGTPIKEEIKTIVTELSPNNNSLVKDEFVFDADLIQIRREITWPDTIAAGETVNISYVLKNVAGKDLKDITISESNSDIDISGSVSALATDEISTGDITSTYDLTSSDIDNGRISASDITYNCKDADDNSYNQPQAETLRPTTEFRIQVIRNRYSAVDSDSSIIIN